MELGRVIEKYQSLPEHVFDSYDSQSMFATLPLAIEQWKLAETSHISKAILDVIDTYRVDGFVNNIVVNPGILIDELDNYQVEPHYQYLSRLIEFVEQWNEHIEHINGSASEILRDFMEALSVRRQAYVFEARFAELPEACREALQDYYYKRFSTLSVRTKNTFRVLSKVDNAVSFVVGNIPLSRYRIRGCGIVSRAEFSCFIEEFKEDMLPLLTEGEDKLRTFLKDYMHRETSSDFPFLTEEEVSELVDMRCRDERIPVLQLLIKFIRRSEQRGACVHRLVYGFDPGAEGATLEEVGQQMGISGERVRQLAMKRLPYPPKLVEYAQKEFEFVDSPVMPDYLDVWQAFIDREDLDIDARRLMALVCTVDDSYTVVSLAKEAHSYLVKKELLRNVKLMTTLRELLKRYALRKTREDVISVTTYVRLSRPSSMFHPNLKLIYPIFMDYMGSLEGVECRNSITIALMPNKISVEDCIIKILDEHGSSMSYRQILDTFRSQYPDYKMDSDATLRSYILRSDRILPIGRSGRYVLSNWENIFTGSLTELMIRCLQESKKPLSLRTLYRRVRVHFPDTTKKSLTTLIYLDKGKNFVTLGSFLYGLKGREYPDVPINEPRSINRMPFRRRFEQVKEFVRTHDRMPMNFSNYESTLWHWLENVESGNISYTEDEWREFREFRRQNALVPQSTGELRFITNCGRVREVVEATGKLPTVREHQFEYTWLNRNRKLYASLSVDADVSELPDNRSRFFVELLRFFKENGLKV